MEVTAGSGKLAGILRDSLVYQNPKQKRQGYTTTCRLLVF
jgi:hypothetical protein